MKPRVLRLVTVLILLALVGGGVYWIVHWKAKAALAEACDGLLAHDPTQDLLGDGPLKAMDVDVHKGDLTDSQEPLDVRCGLVRDVEFNRGKPTHEATVEVRVHGGSFPESVIWSGMHGASVIRGYPPVPLGRGWKGAFNVTAPDDGTEAEGATTILLECAKGRPDLVVTVETREEDVSYDDPKVRLRHARVATATADKASRKWGCGARLGKPLRTVGLPVNDVESTPLRAATGTCAGLPGRRGAVTHGWESRRSDAPLESCVLGDGRTHRGEEGHEILVNSSRRYWLNAYYGAYARERLAYERASFHTAGPLPGDGPRGALARDGYWRGASCPDGNAPVLFTVVPQASRSDELDHPSHAETAYQRSALEAFAKRSAASHGCTLKETKD